MRPVSDRLVEIRGARPGSGYPLTGAPLVIGRDGECQIVVASEHASRRHARIEARGSAYVLRDLGSKNGTSMNGQPVNAEVTLREGDEIAVPGGAWVFRTTDETVTLQLPPAGSVRVDMRRAEVWVEGKQIVVTARELLALAALAEDPGALVTKDDLANKVWPETSGAVSDDSIEQLMSRLRHKLGDDARQPRYLLTVRGLGYRLFSDMTGAAATPSRSSDPRSPRRAR